MRRGEVGIAHGHLDSLVAMGPHLRVNLFRRNSWARQAATRSDVLIAKLENTESSAAV